ncbi:MAG TPA: M48 family metallopeptidase [Burkholderiales bacterium]|nr:M48 family metallopeptidase [Burkholderiales bacterium]
MSGIQALYFDGKSSDRRSVVLELDPRRGLCVRGDGVDAAWPLPDVRASERIGNSRRRLYFPDGSQCETADNDAVDALFDAPPAARLLHRWESRLGYALAAVAITMAAAWAAVVWGIPALAKQVAFALPVATEKLIGRDALAALDKYVLTPSQLPPERQDALRKLLARMSAGPDGDGYRLELRRGGRVGANALALPAGIIVMTDELVELSKDDRELEAVLAHEIGHLRQRHILRHVLEDSGTALLIAFSLGDLTSATTLAAAAPTVLLQAKFSRDFEREADDYALDYMARRGIPPEKFAAILQRMEEKRQGDKDIPDFLSSHPATRERIERAREHRAP